MSLEDLTAVLGQGDVFLYFSSCSTGEESSFPFIMFSVALLSGGLGQVLLKTPLRDGSTMSCDLLSLLALALAGSSSPKMWCLFPTYFGFSSCYLCVTCSMKQ